MGMSASQARLLSITARINDVEFKSQCIANQKIRLSSESEQLAQDYTKALNKQKYQLTTYGANGVEKVDLTLNTLMQPGSRYGLKSISGQMIVSKDQLSSFETAKSTYKYKMDNQKYNHYTEDMANADAKRKFLMESIEKEKNITLSDHQKYALNYNDLMTAGVLTQEQINYYEGLYDQMMVKTEDGAYKSNGGVVLENANFNDPAWLYEAIASGEFILVDLQSGKEVSASETTNISPVSDTSDFAKEEAEYNAANMKINNKEKLLDNEMKKLDTEHNALQTEHDSIKDLIGKNIEKSFNLFS